MSKEFDNNVLAIVKQKGFYPYEYINDFEKFKEELPSKERFYSSLTNRKINDEEYELFLMFGINLKWKNLKIISTCT